MGSRLCPSFKYWHTPPFLCDLPSYYTLMLPSWLQDFFKCNSYRFMIIICTIIIIRVYILVRDKVYVHIISLLYPYFCTCMHEYCRVCDQCESSNILVVVICNGLVGMLLYKVNLSLHWCTWRMNYLQLFLNLATERTSCCLRTSWCWRMSYIRTTNNAYSIIACLGYN